MLPLHKNKIQKTYKHRHLLFPRNRQGFTLVEILVVVSLMSLISASIYHALFIGLRVWEKHQKLILEEDVAIFFHKMEKDARNAYIYAQIPFSGREQRVALPAVIYAPLDKQRSNGKDLYADQMGLVEYYFDPLTGNVYRREANYSQAVNKEFGRTQVLISSVTGFSLRYYFYTDEGVSYSQSVDQILPAGIEVKIAFEDDYGPKEMKKIIDIPLSG